MSFFQKRNVEEDIEEFSKQFKTVQVIIFKYVDLWFSGVCKKVEPFRTKFENKPDIHILLACLVVRYLLPLDENDEKLSEEVRAESESFKNDIPGWADTIMVENPEFAELVIQTLRRYSGFMQYLQITDKDKNKIVKVLSLFGNKFPKTPTHFSYKRLIIKWMVWYKNMKSKKDF